LAAGRSALEALRGPGARQGKQDFAALFRHYDRDNSGELDFDEFRRAVRKDGKLLPL
jgi:Ca2+-binding EF-hand superfamily protein